MDLRGELRWVGLEVRDAWRRFKVAIVVAVIFGLLFNQFAFVHVALLAAVIVVVAMSAVRAGFVVGGSCT
ncbi:hypothetical protein [Rathayibacter toxicus]|uniref:hypothetical protein n=1 Tax=Rathayibacter toxicus TaxID=145458 RepID=UPI001C04BA23|nr:hypothetical protein [Rathayibacter toxicus]QWL31769.1 hypothetical protein E2R35_02205 [Rathayibacter toxicus]QWL33862.1 hypothetical protein E2R36_02205 [Rathayibacter toxicus]QWL35996.1 hypothetical protein E2R37_02205 [Rathayibacter toxicus]QWL38086.1 hypothetical protein E2R38_02205 [Rathayibacter toxicus]QWL40175.1 hypothetical protein E2R39_02205 [Rathayibacter toxicus]